MNKTNIKIIKYIQKECNNNFLWKFKSDSYKDLGISKEEFQKSLNELQILGYITYSLTSTHKNDWKYGGTVTALKPLITYQEERKTQVFSDIYDIIKFIIPLIISVIALIISLLS